MNLRVSYLLPENLRSYVGPVGVWGDVNDILQENLLVMKVLAPHLLPNKMTVCLRVEHGFDQLKQAPSPGAVLSPAQADNCPLKQPHMACDLNMSPQRCSSPN